MSKEPKPQFKQSPKNLNSDKMKLFQSLHPVEKQMWIDGAWRDKVEADKSKQG